MHFVSITYFHYLRPMSTTLCLCHFVFNTHRREMTINPQNEESLYRFIWKILKQKNCKLIRIGGIENHIHLLVDLHPSISMASIAGEIKRLSSLWMNQSGLFPGFSRWGKEYFCFSKSPEDKEKVINYIKNQKEHHKKESFDDEIKRIMNEEGFVWEDNLLT